METSEDEDADVCDDIEATGDDAAAPLAAALARAKISRRPRATRVQRPRRPIVGGGCGAACA